MTIEEICAAAQACKAQVHIMLYSNNWNVVFELTRGGTELKVKSEIDYGTGKGNDLNEEVNKVWSKFSRMYEGVKGDIDKPLIEGMPKGLYIGRDTSGDDIPF